MRNFQRLVDLLSLFNSFVCLYYFKTLFVIIVPIITASRITCSGNSASPPTAKREKTVNFFLKIKKKKKMNSRCLDVLGVGCKLFVMCAGAVMLKVENFMVTWNCDIMIDTEMVDHSMKARFSGMFLLKQQTFFRLLTFSTFYWQTYRHRQNIL